MSQRSAEKIWNDCSSRIQSILPEDEFTKWFSHFTPVSIIGNSLTVEVPNQWFKDNVDARYSKLLMSVLGEVLGAKANLFYKITPVEGQPSYTTPSVAPSPVGEDHAYDPSTSISPYILPGVRKPKIESNLDPDSNFDNFVVGECNKMAVVACEAIYNNPGKSGFNPLFIFGGSGLGKSHIAHAVGLKVSEKFPDLNVLYVAANIFKAQYVNACRKDDKLADFLAWYMKIDVLIIDDIQDLSSDGVQNAIFTIFNHLQLHGKQLIFTSDRPQTELKKFEERLLSRFKWGLSVELIKPDYHTRREMLHRYCSYKGIIFSSDVLDYVAQKVQSNFRELQGVLNSMLAQEILLRKTVTIDDARKAVSQIVGEGGQLISIDKVQSAVCEYFGITVAELVSSSRKRNIVQARQISMYLCREMTGTPLSNIGKATGGKDHSTVLHSCNTVSDLMQTDPVFRGYVHDIQRNLQ